MINVQEFLKPEIRCDFPVSEKRKKVWKVELDILADFVSICQRHDLKYFLFAGSLLGAARHQGIIPWDDDIDVAMPRADYDKLLQIAPTELQEQHVLVTPENREEFYLLFSKICNKNTAAMEDCYWQHGYSYEQGIFLDIFPFDNLPESKFSAKLHHIRIRLSYILVMLRKGFPINEEKYGKLVKFGCNVVKGLLSCISMKRVLSMHHKVVTKYNKRDTKVLSFIAPGYTPAFNCLTEWANDLIDAPFEHLTVKIPRKYDEYLTNHFGDWHKFVRGTSLHSGILFDPDRSYTEYLGKFDELKDTPRDL